MPFHVDPLVSFLTPPQVDRYQEAPHLLDAHLPTLLPSLAAALLAASSSGDAPLVAALGRVLWRGVSARGRKPATKFFPASVDDFEPIVLLLAGVTGVRVAGGGDDGAAATHVATGAALAALPAAWPARTVMLTWLAHAATLPFPLVLLDGRVPVADDDYAVDPAWPPLAAAAAAVAHSCLPSPGPDRDAAAAALAALLARPDACHRLPRAVAACKPALAAAATGGPADTHALGAATALVALFGRAPPPAAAAVAPAAWDALSPLLEAGAHGVATRRAGVKAATRVALALLDSDSTSSSSSSRTNAAAAIILSCLRDRDTAVRLAAAKGVARLGAALAARGAPSAAAALRRGATALLHPSESDAAWHGGCLALAGLLRAGCVPADEYGAAAAAAASALVYDVCRGSASVGAHVRDAGAYVAWALARCRSRAAAAAALAPIGPTLIAAACSDRDVNCRRAAAAAFQEGVGRTGAFPAGLAATAAADFYALATRRGAYTGAAVAVAELNAEYARALVSCFVTKAAHWDRATRDTAADALAAVTGVATAKGEAAGAASKLVQAAASADGDTRHGAFASLAALVRAQRDLGPAAAAATAALPLTWKTAVRGRGGEAVRHALMQLVAALADTWCALPPAAAAAAAAAADDCVRHPAAPVRQAAAVALGALARRPDGGGVPSDAARIYAATVANGHTASATTPPEPRRGAAAALGELPARLLVPHADTVLAVLCAGCGLEVAAAGRDAEARAAAAAALAGVCGTIAPHIADAATTRRLVIHALLPACADYATDRRGDVGAWVRAPAAEGVVTTLAAAAATRDPGASDLAPTVVTCLVRLACERSAMLRAVGRHGLETLLEAGVEGVPERSALAPALADTRAAAAPTNATTSPHTSSDDAALALARCLAVTPALAPAAVTGLAACVGGLDGPLALAAERAFTAAVDTAGGDALVAWLADAWETVLAPPRDARLLTPFLRAVDVVASTDAGTAALAASPALADRVLTLTLSTARGSRDPARLCTAAGALAALAGAGSHAAATRALRSLVLLTAHAFPATRRAAAEALAVRLVVGVDCVGEAEGVAAAGDLVAATAWDGDRGEAVRARAAVCAALGLEAPAEEEAPDTAKPREQASGSGPGGYASLLTAIERGGA